MAEAGSAFIEPRVCKLVDEIDNGKWDAILRTWYKGSLRRYYRTRNTIRNNLWPTSLQNLTIFSSIIWLLMLIEPKLFENLIYKLWTLADYFYIPSELPPYLRSGILSFLIGIIFIFLLIYIRQCLLRLLLSYRGWMYCSLSNPPPKIFIWSFLVRLLSGYQPSLYSFQRSLPRLPVPKLQDTLKKLIDSLEPIVDEQELILIKKQAKEFENGVGPKLQKLIVLKSWLTPNYVSDWWEKYVYLRSRLPLPINCNYYILDHSYWKATLFPTARAAALIYNLMKFNKLILREELPPLLLRNIIPICMSQYERLFATTRIPGEEIDELVHYDSSESTFVIVQSSGFFYKLEVYDAKNQILSAKALETQLQLIIDDIEHEKLLIDNKNSINNNDYEHDLRNRLKNQTKSDDVNQVNEKFISTLTSLERTKWSRIRNKYFRTGLNKETIETIEKAIFCVNLILNEESEDLSFRAKMAMHGNLDNCFWFDKCFNVNIYKNGRCSLNCEHSLADAPAYAHIWEYVLTKDVLETTFNFDGTIFPPNKDVIQDCVRPIRLRWKISNELNKEIEYAKEFHQKSIDDLDLIVVDHETWGKGSIKRSKISPDAFVQAALQMAFYKEQKKFVQTYEASMTRLYLNGRTETVRSCTSEMVDFVLSMNDPKCSKEERIRKLNKMEIKHAALYKDAMNGKGIDRHLFALYIACKGLGKENEFLQNILTRPWILSTSQTPHTQQTAIPDPNWKSFNNKLCAGGGFGPVSNEGYGVSYLFPNDHRIFFHISSKKSCKQTDSVRLGKYLYESLDEIINLFE